MKTVVSLVSVVLLLVALVLNLRAYRNLEPSKRPQARIGLVLNAVSLTALSVLAFLNVT